MEATQLKHIVITGGAGYIGSLLTGELLRLGMKVTVIDDLIFGGESLMGYLAHPNFHFAKANVIEPRAVRTNLRSDWDKPSALVHLAAIVGFPACQAVGRQVAWRYNVEATERVFEQAVSLGDQTGWYMPPRIAIMVSHPMATGHRSHTPHPSVSVCGDKNRS